MSLIDVDNYVNYRIKPSQFFIAVLSNDLYSACKLCFSPSDLLESVKYIQDRVPSEARGTLFNVEQWLEGKTN